MMTIAGDFIGNGNRKMYFAAMAAFLDTGKGANGHQFSK
jgi:hypothetical protein